jgi:hypothetical protein
MFMLPKSQQRYFLTAVLFALLARALVPAGFMPTATADGFTVTLCSSLEFNPVALPNSPVPNDTDPADSGHDLGGAGCVFAQLSQAFLPSNAGDAATIARLDESTRVPVVVDSVGSSSTSLVSLPPVRGPPQSA